MICLPFCPEHGLRIHKNGFVYYNGDSEDDLKTATKRNLMFHGDLYIANFFKKNIKMESSRLCYENSEDAISYNVFTELLARHTLNKLVSKIIKSKRGIEDNVNLYLWGRKIDLKVNGSEPYSPFNKVRDHLEGDIKRFKTEPDIMLVVPGKVVVCIEAKFGSKNPIAEEKEELSGDKPKQKGRLIDRYCKRNTIINTDEIFDFANTSEPFYSQLFRNTVFAASMAKLEGAEEWYVVNLRNQHVMNIKRDMPESTPVLRNVRSMLKPKYKKRFVHLTWEDLYKIAVKDDPALANLTWYLKNKSLNCGRAFNII
jgi:hypothetical protein